MRRGPSHPTLRLVHRVLVALAVVGAEVWVITGREVPGAVAAGLGVALLGVWVLDGFHDRQ